MNSENCTLIHANSMIMTPYLPMLQYNGIYHMLHTMFERSNSNQLERYPTTSENHLVKRSKVENKHILRLSKSILLENYLTYIQRDVYKKKKVKHHCLLQQKNWKQAKSSTVQEKINYGILILREYQTMVKMNQLELHISSWMNHTILREKGKHVIVIPFKWAKAILHIA